MTSIRVTRSLTIPDALRISRYKKIPELGPRVLFFSGGSALNSLCKTLKNYTHNSVHLITPFDSGGSSAELRKAFDMPSIGDLRSRLMALADESVLGHPEVVALFNHRLDKHLSQETLKAELAELIRGKSPLINDIANPMRKLICNQLGYFFNAMPKNFDLRGASIGNLILTGGYLNNHRHLDPIIFLFSKLVNVQGTVRAIVNDDLHLGADLEDGSELIGQHLLTGKEVPPLNSAINQIFLSEHPDIKSIKSTAIRKKTRKLIESAELICYPPGSFFSSLLANLIPEGVGKAIAENDCPKVYIPNLGSDPEQFNMDLTSSVERLLAQLHAGCDPDTSNQQLLNFVLLDSRNGIYPSRLSTAVLKSLNVELIDTRLVSKQSAPYYDNELLVSALMSLT
ncbi:Gluconeogenesis factor [Zhongshania aliphaticivorans]|uniref:Gluconeogenesis factor n=1 Tax=Zhongshania aliphaticivorans TaxID=1470434 RepID=A0A5S9MVU1_9GAMM|nr:GAK system CofD-like protein [Zhongshania aliphaticivorans]CAA0081199.1 Gluconeogenesis factor [Zhongshania aliphaticivorans]CAA0085059.1 Gluconeogenesis factor [Zhongshania aliphaticivorans]